MTALRIFGWHVHGSYMNALVQGRHEYLLASLPEKGAYGLGRADTWDWPTSVQNVTPDEAADIDVDLVLLQRPEELQMAETWLNGRRPGRDVPALYLEHNAPQGRISEMDHPMCDRDDIEVVHVTHFNRLFWNCGIDARVSSNMASWIPAIATQAILRAPPLSSMNPCVEGE